MAHIKILSDYSSASNPNVLHIMYDDQGDIHIWTYCDTDNDDQSIRLANTGSRHKGDSKPRLWKAVRELIEAYQEGLNEPHCHPDLKALNDVQTVRRHKI